MLGFLCYVGFTSAMQVVIMMYVFASKINTSLQKKSPKLSLLYHESWKNRCVIPYYYYYYFLMQVGWKYKINACKEVNQRSFGFQWPLLWCIYQYFNREKLLSWNSHEQKGRNRSTGGLMLFCVGSLLSTRKSWENCNDSCDKINSVAYWSCALMWLWLVK